MSTKRSVFYKLWCRPRSDITQEDWNTFHESVSRMDKLEDMKIRRIRLWQSSRNLMYGDSDSLYLHLPFDGNRLYPPMHVQPRASQSESHGNHTAEV